jgi:hypothetical protein
LWRLEIVFGRRWRTLLFYLRVFEQFLVVTLVLARYAFLFGKDQVVGLVLLSVHRLVLVHGARFKLLGHHLALHGRLRSFDIVALHFGQVELLGTQD